MRFLVLSMALLALLVGAVRADRPAVVAVSSMDSICVKLADAAGYLPGSELSYEIRHWPDGKRFLAGCVRADAIQTDACGFRNFTLNNLRPMLWSPQDPQLYEVTVANSNGRTLGAARFGFRAFEARNGKFYLNNRPIFLRGLPINPPGRNLPEAMQKDPQFIRGYLKLVKSAGVNMIRTEPREWLDACDEIGIMVFAGHYGPTSGGSDGNPPPLEKAQPFYRDMVLNLSSHPSVMIYVLTNEVDYKSKESTWKQFLTKVREDIRPLDPTRPVIGNAGFGLGEPGEVYDIHRYSGWYSGSLCDWCADISGYLSDAGKAGKPLTMTECVGAYTSDAGDFLTMSKQLCTMTKWVGGADDPRAAALEYQAELVRQVVEISRRQRTDRANVAGVMPFTYFLGWANAKKAGDLIVKPAFETLRVVFQPVLISPECWRRNLYAGDSLKMRLCVANDDDSSRDIAPSQAVVDVVAAGGRVVASRRADFPATLYYSNTWADVSVPIPSGLARGYYEVRCRLLENGVEISRNSFQITVAPRNWARASGVSVTLFDPSGDTAKALSLLGVSYKRVKSLGEMPKGGVLVIGEGALGPGGYPDAGSVSAFLSRGGRILCLRQDREKWDCKWLPAQLNMEQRRPFTYIQPVGGNSAIFDGLHDRDLRYWNEIGLVANAIPNVYPVFTALKPTNAADLRSTRVWASCDQLLSGAAIAEVYSGSGSVILSQFRAVERVKSDPIAAKLLSNLVSYAASGKSPGLLDLTKPMRWDLSAFRSGAFASRVQGFLPHSKTYKHEGGSKGLLGDDHRIDGFTLVGNYQFDGNGWLRPPPDPAAEGWGILYGTLSRPATRFTLRLRNVGETPAAIALRLDSKVIGSALIVPPGSERNMEWNIKRKPGPVEVELRGDQRLVITQSCFR